jgi:N-acyl-D-amino-acid deacylase
LSGFLPLYSPHTHPRAYGSMPRFLGHYVRDLHLTTLPEGIRKITSLPALREHLKDRGILQEGYFADVTVFDPARIIDTASYHQPAQVSRGVKYVLVNGQVEFENGRLTGITAGRPLRGRAWGSCQSASPVE